MHHFTVLSTKLVIIIKTLHCYGTSYPVPNKTPLLNKRNKAIQINGPLSKIQALIHNAFKIDHFKRTQFPIHVK